MRKIQGVSWRGGEAGRRQHGSEPLEGLRTEPQAAVWLSESSAHRGVRELRPHTVTAQEPHRPGEAPRCSLWTSLPEGKWRRGRPLGHTVVPITAVAPWATTDAHSLPSPSSVPSAVTLASLHGLPASDPDLPI